MKLPVLAVSLALAVLLPPGASAQLIISEFRLHGTNGPNDEFIELYNNSGADVTVSSSDGSAGWAVAASDGIMRFTIPNGTVIPNRGHYLGCNSVSYSLAGYPAGNGTTATCDATYTTNIPNGEDPDGAGSDPPLPRRGIALFSSANPANFTLVNRLDAVGPTSESNSVYKEGTGVRELQPLASGYSYVRRLPGGCIGTNPGTVDSNCTNSTAVIETAEALAAVPQDTNNNRADFIFVDNNGSQLSAEGSQQRLGAPGPENLSSPIQRQASLRIELIDPTTCSNCPPNRVRDLTNDPGEPNDTFGSVFFRRRVINNTGANVTRLRFRIVDLTTFPAAVFSLPPPPNDVCGAPGSDCAADLRALSSTQVVVSTAGGNVTVQGTTLEQAASAEAQPNGGGFNSTLSANTITLATPLPPSDNPATPDVRENEINVQMRFGVQQEGALRMAFIIEVLP